MRFGQFTKLRILTERLLADDPEMLRQLNETKLKFLAIYEQFLKDAAARFSQVRSARPLAG
jgi:hypothetical protein